LPPTSYRLQLAGDAELVVWFLTERVPACQRFDQGRAGGGKREGGGAGRTRPCAL
jgi:hypothetical protein